MARKSVVFPGNLPSWLTAKKHWLGVYASRKVHQPLTYFITWFPKKQTLFHNLSALLLFGGQEWTEHFHLFIG
jgi:hypothetical protein